MRYLEDSVHIDVPPIRVWDWLLHLSEHYPEWHPDHVSAEWVSGPPNQVGSVLRAVERLDNQREELLFELIAVEPPHHLAFRIGRWIGLLLPRGSFIIDPDKTGGCWFTSRIGYRFGGITERLFRVKTARLRVHMAEEGACLKRLLEAA